jgi:hypothetical protein
MMPPVAGDNSYSDYLKYPEQVKTQTVLTRIRL